MFPKIFKMLFASLMLLSYANLIMSCSHLQKIEVFTSEALLILIDFGQSLALQKV